MTPAPKDTRHDQARSHARCRAALPPKQSALFEFLSRDIDGDLYGAESMAARIGSERSSVTKLAGRIEHKLRIGKAKWRLQSAMGIGGGYRLVTSA